MAKKKLTRAEARALIAKRARTAFQMVKSLTELAAEHNIPSRDLLLIFIRDVYLPWKGRRPDNEALVATVVSAVEAMPRTASMTEMTESLGGMFGVEVQTIRPSRTPRTSYGSLRSPHVNIRLFAAMDTSPYGKRAWAYVDAILKVVGKEHLRLISAGPLDLWPYDDRPDPWTTHQDLLMTTLAEPFKNIVCCDPAKVDPRRYYMTPTPMLDGRPSPCRGNYVVLSPEDAIQYAVLSASAHTGIVTGFTILPPRPDPALAGLLTAL